MQVKSILTCPPTIADSDTAILSVSQMMREDGTGAVIILNEGGLVGIVTDRDIAIQLTAFDPPALALPISQIMTPDPLTCFEDQDVADAAVIMADHQVRRLPVMNHADHVVGLLSVDLIAENYSEHMAGETLGEIVELRLRKPCRARKLS